MAERARRPVRGVDHRGWVTLALRIVVFIGGGLRTLVGDNPAYERVLGPLALLARVTVLAVAAYLHRPRRALDEPTFRTDPEDQVRNFRVLPLLCPAQRFLLPYGFSSHGRPPSLRHDEYTARVHEVCAI